MGLDRHRGRRASGRAVSVSIHLAAGYRADAVTDAAGRPLNGRIRRSAATTPRGVDRDGATDLSRVAGLAPMGLRLSD